MQRDAKWGIELPGESLAAPGWPALPWAAAGTKVGALTDSPSEPALVLRNDRRHAAVASFLPATAFTLVVLVVADGPSRPYFVALAILMLWLATIVQFWLLVLPRLELRPDSITAVSFLNRQRVPWCDITEITPPRLRTGGRLCIRCASRALPVLPAAPRMMLWPYRDESIRTDTEHVLRWWRQYRSHAAPYRLWDLTG